MRDTTDSNVEPLVHVTGAVSSLYACSECGDAFVPLRKGQGQCGKRRCADAHHYKRRRDAERATWYTGPQSCPSCETVFEPLTRNQKTCGAALCRHRLQWHARKNAPDYRQASRERFARWYSAKRGGSSEREPWLAGAPITSATLPGGMCTARIEPRPAYAVALKDMRAVHGCMTSVLGIDHTPNVTDFALSHGVRDGEWRLYIRDEDVLAAVADGRHQAQLFGRDVLVSIGSPTPWKAPIVTQRGRRRVAFEAITPVCVRRGLPGRKAFVQYRHPTTTNIMSALLGPFLTKLGVDVRADSLLLTLVESRTETAEIQFGGKYGTIAGWVGHCVVETNATGEWLLRCAEQIGLGGRTAFGLGRIAIR